MNRNTMVRWFAVPGALALIVLGVLHGIIGVADLRRALERGEIPARLGDSHLVNWAFSGAVMSLLGVLVLIVLPGLRAGSRQAARVVTAIGGLIGAFGAGGFLWVPTKPAVLVFLVLGALLAAPPLIGRREFLSP
jgi:hypothetical protein